MAAERRGPGAEIPQPTLERLPVYLNYLKMRRAEGVRQIASTAMADDLRMTGIQVRKDLAYVSSGRPRTGRDVGELIACLEETLGCRENKDVVLVGVGRLGQALLAYDGFRACGFQVVAAFDADESLIGMTIRGRTIRAAAGVTDFVRRAAVQYGIITVSADHAQSVCDQLVRGGVRAILNFAPVYLNAPEGVVVRNVDIAASLLLLSNALALMDDHN